MQKGRISNFLAILKDQGFDDLKHSVVLDLGCGDRVAVKELRDNGYEAYGCDVSLERLRNNAETRHFETDGIVKAIKNEPYQLPFDDSTFDLVVSYQVFEHVKDYAATLSEVCRVLKPRGATLNIFPSRYRLFEPHGGIPLGSLIQHYWWLRLWTTLGIHGNKKGLGLTPKEIADYRYWFLNNHTNYLSKKRIHRHFANFFPHVSFCDREALRYSPKARSLYSRMSGTLSPSFLGWLYSTFGSRAVLAVKD